MAIIVKVATPSLCDTFTIATLERTSWTYVSRWNLKKYRMDDSSYRLNFDLGKRNKIHHHSQKERVKISKIAKFGCEML
jgi:hypothetical protein